MRKLILSRLQELVETLLNAKRRLHLSFVIRNIHLRRYFPYANALPVTQADKSNNTS